MRRFCIWDYVKVPWECSRREVSGFCVITLILSVFPMCETVLIACIVDSVSANNMYSMVLFAALLLVEVFVRKTSGPVLERLSVVIQCNMSNKVMPLVLRKFSKMQYKFFEDTQSMALFARVTRNTDKLIFSGFSLFVDIMCTFIQVMSVLILLGSLIWWIPGVIVLICIPTFLVSASSGQKEYSLSVASSYLDRQADYLKGLLMSRDAVDERTLFSFGSFINNQWVQKDKETVRNKLIARKWSFVKMKLAGGGILLSFFVVITILWIPLTEEKLSIGLYSTLCTMLLGMTHVLSWSLGSQIKDLAEKNKLAKDLDAFFCLEDDGREAYASLRNPENLAHIENVPVIEFTNVSFSYPNSDRKVLDDLTFSIYPEKRTLLVGANGSGKSTIIKLLIGLYKDYEGEIRIYGKDIRAYSDSELRNIFSVVFQEFAKYQISVEDNIVLGAEKDNEKIENILTSVGLKKVIENFPEKTKERIGNIWKDGRDLSLGQWQKLAIARTLYRSRSIYILDEPTSAIDPTAEVEVLKTYLSLLKDNTSIFITHRLGMAKYADNILVINNGKLAESGTHHNLITVNGLYKEMFEAQKRWYINDKE